MVTDDGIILMTWTKMQIISSQNSLRTEVDNKRERAISTI